MAFNLADFVEHTVDAVPDLFATVTNATGDFAAAVLVAARAAGD